MKKMSDVFDMSKSIGYNSNWSDEQVRAADKAIKMHDELVAELQMIAIDIEGNDDFVDVYNKIDSLLERCK